MTKLPNVSILRDITPEILEQYKQHRKTAEISKNGKKRDLTKKETSARSMSKNGLKNAIRAAGQR